MDDDFFPECCGNDVEAIGKWFEHPSSYAFAERRKQDVLTQQRDPAANDDASRAQ